MAKWKDSTRGWDPPITTESEVRFCKFKLSIHRNINYPKDMWFASCGYLFNCHELASKDMGEAKCQAKAHLQTTLKDTLDEIEKEES